MGARPERARGTAAERSEQDQLVARNLGLVYALATRLCRRGSVGPERGDLIGAGVRGLIQAAEVFDATRGLSFSTLAVARIRGAMLDELRRWDYVPRSVRERERQIRACDAKLRARLHRSPTVPELAQELGTTTRQLHDWYLRSAHQSPEPLEEARPFRLGDPRSVPDEWAEEGESVIDAVGREQLITLVERCLALLPEREGRVLALYYLEELRLREIADVLGVTEGRVSQVKKAALENLRALLGERGVDGP